MKNMLYPVHQCSAILSSQMVNKFVMKIKCHFDCLKVFINLQSCVFITPLLLFLVSAAGDIRLWWRWTIWRPAWLQSVLTTLIQHRWRSLSYTSSVLFTVGTLLADLSTRQFTPGRAWETIPRQIGTTL